MKHDVSDGMIRITICLALSIWLDGQAFAQEPRVEVRIQDHRPIAKAVESIISEQPLVITYEDPVYEYTGDVRDIAPEVRRDLSTFAPGTAPKLMVPIERPVILSYQRPAGPSAAQWAGTLQAILAAHAVQNDGGGRFAVKQVGDVLHVVPTANKDRLGRWIEARSILDTPITIPKSQLDGISMVSAILEQVSTNNGVKVQLGTIPTELMANYYGELEASGEGADAVLLRALHAMDYRLTWRLLYSPEQGYALNVRAVAGPPRAPITRRVPARPGTEPGPSPFLSPEAVDRSRSAAPATRRAPQ